VVVCAVLALALTDGAVVSSRSASASGGSRATPGSTRVSTPPERRVFLLGLRQRGNPGQFASQVSNPASPLYRRFLSLGQYQNRFSPSTADRRGVLRYLTSQRGVVKVELSSDKSVVLSVLTPQAERRIFCARGGGAPMRGLCTPPGLRRWVREISAGEVYQLGGNLQRGGAREPAKGRAGTALRCQGTKARAFTPTATVHRLRGQ
jgi:hypothetical protein